MSIVLVKTSLIIQSAFETDWNSQPARLYGGAREARHCIKYSERDLMKLRKSVFQCIDRKRDALDRFFQSQKN